MKLSKERVKELLAAERKLNALDSAGVDNWEGYDFAMEKIREEEEREALALQYFESIQEELSQAVDQPAGPGCGYGFFGDHADAAFEIFKRAIRDKKLSET